MVSVRFEMFPLLIQWDFSVFFSKCSRKPRVLFCMYTNIIIGQNQENVETNQHLRY